MLLNAFKALSHFLLVSMLCKFDAAANTEILRHFWIIYHLSNSLFLCFEEINCLFASEKLQFEQLHILSINKFNH